MICFSKFDFGADFFATIVVMGVCGSLGDFDFFSTDDDGAVFDLFGGCDFSLGLE